MPHLFDSFTLRDVTFRNRIGVSPMCQYWSEEGMPSDWHLVHLGSRAVGGAGLVIAEASAVEADGRITPRCAGIWSDNHIEPWARVARFVREYGAVAGMQIAHAGRKGSTAPPWLRGGHDVNVPVEKGGWIPVAPSPLPYREGSVTPKELSIAEIHRIRQSFVDAAKRVLSADFRFLELHFAHGYLANEFLSPLTNKRTDVYGGTFENRTRFALETARAVRAVWPEQLPLSVRLSVTDWVEGGWTTEDSVALAKLLKAEGVDIIDCSSGAVVPNVKYPAGPGWQVPLADAVRKGAGIATASVGMIKEPKQADAIIREEKADMVLLASQFLHDAYWPFHASKELQPEHALRMPAPYDYVVNPHG